MITRNEARRLKWLHANALAKYERLLDYFSALQQQTASELDIAEMHIKLGEPLKGIEKARITGTENATVYSRKLILLARALQSMRIPAAGAYLLLKAIKSGDFEENYDLCLELGRLNAFMGVNTRNPHEAKEHIESAVGTLKHCIRIDARRPEAYILLAKLAAPYREWHELALSYYHQFEAVTSGRPEAELGGYALIHAFFASHYLGRSEEARQWLETAYHLIDEKPWEGDRFVFSGLGEAFDLVGDGTRCEEAYQCAWLLASSKGGSLVRMYARQGYLLRVLQMLQVAYRNTDLREYRWRLAFSKARGTEKKQILADLTGVSF